MKLHCIAIFSLGLLTTQVSAEDTQELTSKADQVSAEDTQELMSKADKLGYSIGYNIANSLKQQGIKINKKLLLKGIADVFSGKNPLLSEQEVQQNLKAFRKERMAKMQKVRKRQARKNMAQGEAFLAENAKKEGVVTLASGLQYKEIKPGTGNTPKSTDEVITHYRGTLIDGTEFDSSYKRGEPITFAVNGVIAGWTEALQLMKVGAKWQLFIPGDLAYGRRGAAGGKIPPNATLIFDIELLSIK
jgi:FKBP-type peptidyl-prolyl cis-trans isomerase FklB